MRKGPAKTRSRAGTAARRPKAQPANAAARVAPVQPGSPQALPKDLRERLLALRSSRLCLADWGLIFGPELHRVQPLLAKCIGEMAKSYPAPDTGLRLRVDPREEGFLAHPVGDFDHDAEDLTLTEKEVQLWQLNWAMVESEFGEGKGRDLVEGKLSARVLGDSQRIVDESASVLSVPAGAQEAGEAGSESTETDVEPVWVNDSYYFELNGARTRTYGGRFLLGKAVAPRKLADACAGRVRLVLRDHALEFNVLGKEVLTVVRIVRVVTEGASPCVEIQGGPVRKIGMVTFPGLSVDEKTVVRGALLSKGMAGDSVFGLLPTALLENGWKSIRLPSGKILNLGGRRARRGRILEAVWKYCLEKGTREVPFGIVLEDFEKDEGTRAANGDRVVRFKHDVFREQKVEFDEMFDQAGAAKDEKFRLSVRFVRPG